MYTPSAIEKNQLPCQALSGAQRQKTVAIPKSEQKQKWHNTKKQLSSSSSNGQQWSGAAHGDVMCGLIIKFVTSEHEA